MTGTTGHQCPNSGIWRTEDTCREEIALSYGERFPPCSGCRRAVTWRLIRSTR
jgi:hypothetical protein